VDISTHAQTLIWIVGGVVGFILYVNIGWLQGYFLENPEKAGIFKIIFNGPEDWFNDGDNRDSYDIDLIDYLFWPIVTLILVLVWFAWLLSGGPIKKIVGYKK
jgi:hypothetical protein